MHGANMKIWIKSLVFRLTVCVKIFELKILYFG